MQSTEQKLRSAVYTVLEGCTLNHDVRKILEAAYYAPEALALPTADECWNCFEGRSDMDHDCPKCGGTGFLPAPYQTPTEPTK